MDTDTIVSEFVTEALDSLEPLEADLRALQHDCTDERIASIFRGVHNIKGVSGFLGFEQLGALSHGAESLLSQVRDRSITVNAEIIETLVAVVDGLHQVLTDIQATGSESPQPHHALLERLAPQNGTPISIRPIDASARVDVHLLDELMADVQELMLTRNQILQHTIERDEPNLTAIAERLTYVTDRLRNTVTKTRLRRIEEIWERFPRIVRGLAATCDKKIRVDLKGDHTEIDTTLLEAIIDPLTHIIRNAADHGIESPETRRQRGKPEEGLIECRAFNDGAKVNIEIADDGGGIDADVIRTSAIAGGFVTAESAASLSRQEILNLVFLPGFTTADHVTRISGRGVGMDVVRTNIERIGGTVDLQSQLGHGSTVRIKIPLALSIVPCLIVRSRHKRYAIPQISILETAHVDVDGSNEFTSLRGCRLQVAHLDEVLEHTKTNDDPCGGGPNVVVLRTDGRRFGLVVDAIEGQEDVVVKPLARSDQNTSKFIGATITGDGSVALILDVLAMARSAGVVARGRRRLVASAQEDVSAA